MSYLGRETMPLSKGTDMSGKKHQMTPEQTGRAAAEGAEVNLPCPPPGATALDKELWRAIARPRRDLKQNIRQAMKERIKGWFPENNCS